MEDVGQGRLDQLPAGNALDGPGQLRGQPVELVFHQYSLKGLREGRKADIRRKLQPLSAAKCPTWPPDSRSVSRKHHYGYEFIMGAGVEVGGGKFVKC